MTDPRFYALPDPVTAAEIAEVTGAELVQGAAGTQVHDVGPLSVLGDGMLGYALAPRSLPTTPPDGGVVLCPAKVAEKLADWPVVVLVHDEAQRAYAGFAREFIKPRKPVDTAVPVAASAKIGRNTSIAWNATISEDAVIGDNVRIGPGASIGPGVSIGADSNIGGGVQIAFAEIGERAHISPNAVIGAAGFGVVVGSDGPEDIPQLGYVIIGDDVTIGAGSTIDRAMFGTTRIGNKCKIDNLVQIGHNVVMGEACLLAAQVGISGSVRLGDRVVLAGKAGIKEHLRLGDGAVLMGNSALMHDIPAGEIWAGVPAKPSKQLFRELRAIAKLTEATAPGAKK